MKNTHKHFWNAALSHAERRLIGMAGEAPKPMPGEAPESEVERGESARRSREKNRPSWDYVEEKLDQVVHRVSRGNKKREDLLRDPLIRRLIMAQVRLEAGSNVRWLPDTLLETAPDWHPAYENGEEELEGLKGDMHGEVTDLFDSIESIVKWLDAALKDYEVRIDENRERISELEGELKKPDLSDADKKAKETEKEILLERIKVQENARDIVKNARDVLDERIKSQEATIRAQEDLLDDASNIIADKVKSEITGELLSPEEKKEALDDIKEKAKLGFTAAEPEERKNVEAAHKEITARIAALDSAQDLLLKDNFHERREYLLRFGGFTAKLLLAQALRDGVYDPDLLAIDLEILGYDFDIDELKKYKNNKEELLKYLTSKRSETLVYKEGGVEIKGNTAGVSLSEMYLRSQMPEDVLEAIKHEDLKDINLGVLFGMAKVDKDKTFEDNFASIFDAELFTEIVKLSGGTEVQINEKNFVDTLAFMLFEKDEEGIEAREKDEKSIEARKKAKKVFDELIKNKTFNKIDCCCNNFGHVWRQPRC